MYINYSINKSFSFFYQIFNDKTHKKAHNNNIKSGKGIKI